MASLWGSVDFHSFHTRFCEAEPGAPGENQGYQGTHGAPGQNQELRPVNTLYIQRVTLTPGHG